MHPAGPGTGVVFRRGDVSSRIADVPARFDRVTASTMGTTISNDESVSVATVEHLLAALSGSGIDNVIVELDAGEVPIMDGSAAPFMMLLECAGAVEQCAQRRTLRVLKHVELREGDKVVSIGPADELSVGFEIDFDSAAVCHQSGQFAMNNGAFKSELSRARTFGFLKEVDMLRANGFALGGSLDNAVVVDEDKILNEDGLRYPDEFVRHKMMDVIGDLYLAGAPVEGHFYGVRSGHSMNNKLLHALFSDRSAWCWSSERTPRDGSELDWQDEAEAAIA
jgi:UDP-3-O-[3-hydroxymyristoyl] N-acetylglucosamine deacetylase